MVAPITGPFSWTKTLPGPVAPGGFVPIHYSKYVSTTYKQTMPIDRPLAYNMRIWNVVSYVDFRTSPGYTQHMSAPAFNSAHQTVATNKCYGGFVDKAKIHSALMATNVLEAGSAMEMMTNRLTQIRRFSSALRRFQFGRAARILAIPSQEERAIRERLTGRKAAKHYANNWLEFHFGWAPLLDDIHTALETFCDPYPALNPVKNRCSYNDNSFTSTGSLPNLRTTTATKSSCLMGAEFTVNNPNSLLMNQMGFINPASIAWEAVPFSFVVDWFANVGQVLSAYTDFVGLSMKNPYTTKFQCITADVVAAGTYPVYYDYPYVHSVLEWITLYIAKYQSIYVTRSTSITGPVLALKPFKGFSPIRGLTAASLLVQTLKDGGKLR